MSFKMSRNSDHYCQTVMNPENNEDRGKQVQERETDHFH